MPATSRSPAATRVPVATRSAMAPAPASRAPTQVKSRSRLR
jgi:hypothetical protein